jgi:uncharacterized MAPEG superfamily protein
MNPSAVALLGFAAWTLLLIITIVSIRSYFVLTGQRQSAAFDPGGADISPFSQRLCRAHANCYENLPIFAALIAVALITSRNELTDGLAMFVLYARLGQSIVHLISTSPWMIRIRFAFYLVQLLVMAIMAWRLLMI